MTLIPSRHLVFSPSKIENLYFETSQSLTPDVWDCLEKGVPSYPGLLDQPGSSPPESPALKNLKSVVNSYLKRGVLPQTNLESALSSLEYQCRPTGRVLPPCHFLWSDPKRVFRLSLRYAKVYLEKEAKCPQAFLLDLDLARKSIGRPGRKEELEQQPATLATTQARIQLVEKQFPKGARVLILGDDDLMSLAFSQAYEVDTFELDDELLSFLSQRVSENVRLVHKDLTRGLPVEFHNAYDVVITDPMYAAAGMEHFLSCCATALKDEHSRLYLSTNPSLLEDSDGFFAGLSAHRLTVEERLEHFNRYPVPEDVREDTVGGLVSLGYDPTLVQALLRLPYLYADLFVCAL